MITFINSKKLLYLFLKDNNLKNKGLIFFLVLFVAFGQSQTKSLDSLINELSNTENDLKK